MAFCLPFSTALTLIFSAFGTLFGLVGFDWEAFKKVIRHPIAILCVALFGWLALSMLWSIAPKHEMIEGISKYRKLLYVPLIGMLLISTRVKPWFLMNFFVAGCLIVCAGSLFSSTGLAELVLGPQNAGGAGWRLGGSPDKAWFLIGPPEKPTFGRAHIAQGAFLTFSFLYLLGSLRIKKTTHTNSITLEPITSIYMLPALSVLLFVMFNIGGMTGYVLTGCGLLLWIVGLYSRKKKVLALASSFFAITLLLLAYNTNSSVEKRVTKFKADIYSYINADEYTSEGLRLSFWQAGLHYGLQSPIAGVGVGGYAEKYSLDMSQPENLRLTRPHPHSEYILQLVQGGMVGLLLWGLLLASISFQIKRSLNGYAVQKNREILSPHLVALVFMIDGLFNSVLWDAGEGHFFPVLFATIASLSLKSEPGQMVP